MSVISTVDHQMETARRRSCARRRYPNAGRLRAFATVVGAALLSVAVAAPAGDDPTPQETPSIRFGCAVVDPIAVARPSGIPVVRQRRFRPAPPNMGLLESIRAEVQRQAPRIDPTEITSVTKNWVAAAQAWDLQITWSGGTAPYTVVRSATPTFEWAVQTLAKGFPGMAFTSRMAQEELDGLYFDVADPTVASAAVRGRGYDPQPLPGSPTVTSSTGWWWGSELQYDAAYLDPIAAGNLSFFNRLVERAFQAHVPAGSEYADLAKFIVPLDARRASPATIQARGTVSPGASTVSLTYTLSQTDLHLRGIVWAPQTGHVWVAADSLVAEVDLFQQSPTKTDWFTDIVKPYISRVSDNGTFVVVDGSAPGNIYRVSVTTGERTLFAQTHDEGFSRVIQPVGIALSPSGQVCYVADGQGPAVVRIPAGAGPGFSTIIDGWGGTDGFHFADPTAIDVNVGFQAIVLNDNDGKFWILTGATTRTEGPFIGAGAHILDIDRDLSEPYYPRWLTVPPSANGPSAGAEAFNLNLIGAQPAAYHGAVVYGSGSSLSLYPEDRDGQIYTIQPNDPQRVVISNADSTVPFTSPLQVADRVIKFTISGFGGLEYRLKLIDPPDSAAYAPEGGWSLEGRTKNLPYEGNDNREDLSTANVGLSLSPDGPWSKTLNVTPDSTWRKTVYLKVTDRYAGDNYQVEVMKCAPSGCGSDSSGVLTQRVVALSPIFTAWKRVFVERDRMFRRGGLLAEDYLTEGGTCGGQGQDPCCGQPGALACNQVKVYGWSDVSPADWIVLFDQSESLPDYSFFFERLFPPRMVLTVGDPDAQGFRVVTFDEPLERNFHSSSMQYRDDFGFLPDFANYQTAGFGVVSGCDLAETQVNGGSSCFYEADLGGVERPFADAFVEVSAPRAGVSFVPFIAESFFDWESGHPPGPGEHTPVDLFSWIWFAHRTEDPSNYREFIGAGTCWLGALYGLTTTTNYHWTYLFRGSIEIDGVGHSNEEIQNHTRFTTVHELGHHFHVKWCTNPPPPEEAHHHNDAINPVRAWCQVDGACPPFASTEELCIMNNGSILGAHDQNWDPFFEFDLECLFAGDSACAGPPSTEPGLGSIRAEEDPLF